MHQGGKGTGVHPRGFCCASGFSSRLSTDRECSGKFSGVSDRAGVEAVAPTAVMAKLRAIAREVLRDIRVLLRSLFERIKLHL